MNLTNFNDVFLLLLSLRQSRLNKIQHKAFNMVFIKSEVTGFLLSRILTHTVTKYYVPHHPTLLRKYSIVSRVKDNIDNTCQRSRI